MHNLLGSLQIWEQRRITQKSCVQLFKYSTVYLASLQRNFMLLCTCRFNQKCSAFNPFQNQIRTYLELYPYFLSSIRSFLLFTSKTSSIHSFLCYFPILKILFQIQICLPRHFLSLYVHQRPNSQSLTEGDKVDNPVPQSTLSPRKGLGIWLQIVHTFQWSSSWAPGRW